MPPPKLPTRSSARIADKQTNEPIMSTPVKLVVGHVRNPSSGKQLSTNRMDLLRRKNLAIREGDMHKLNALNNSPAKSTRTQSTTLSKIDLEALEKEAAAAKKVKAAAKAAAKKSGVRKKKVVIKKKKPSSSPPSTSKSVKSTSSKGSSKSNSSKGSEKSNASKGSKGTAASRNSIIGKKPSAYERDEAFVPQDEDDEPTFAKNYTSKSSRNESPGNISDDTSDITDQAAKTTFHGSFHGRAMTNAISQTPMAQEHHRLVDERNSLVYQLQEIKKKYANLKDDYDALDSDYYDQRDRYKGEVADLKAQLQRMTTSLAMTGKKDMGNMSSEMVATVKRLVLEKSWWGTKFVETQEDLIEETNLIADFLGFNDMAEKAAWISLYSGAVLNAFNKERQYANNGCFEAAKSKLCVFTKMYCNLYTNLLLNLQFYFTITTRIYG